MTLSHPLVSEVDVVRLLADTRCVMFDFDGPLADLFAQHTAPDVAVVLRERVASWEAPSSGTPAPTSVSDPFQVLLDVATAYRGRPEYQYRVAELDKLLREQEAKAAETAVPTPHVDDAIRALVNRGIVLSVTTNNSSGAVSQYLERQGLAECFGGRVHGRQHGRPELMKPDPAVLREALRWAEFPPESCLMIGDSPSDFTAAEAIGVAFLGYAKNSRKRRLLEQVGVRNIVHSLHTVVDAAKHG
jgi:phosphoglycolate phosphatase